MAKQIEDTKTPDLLGEPKRRGRPATGTAMSAAERKRAQRERARTEFQELTKKLEDMTTTALFENLQHAVAKGWAEDAREIGDELVRRAEARRAA